MAITEDQIVLYASNDMSDTPEGGRGPSGRILESGKSNNIFPDVGTIDRAGGVLNHRQMFAGVRSHDTDLAKGINVMVSLPPEDPNISILLMKTTGDFATRAQDIAQLEAGFVASGRYSGELFSNHLQGQSIIQLIQRESSEPPTPGEVLALVYREGAGDEYTQYVQVRRIQSNQVMEFEDANGVYKRRVVSVQIGQQLKRSFPGFDAQRATINESQLSARTKIRTSVWSPAARYFGIKPLTAIGTLGQMTVYANGIYDRIVPSAESETNLAAVDVAGYREGIMQSGNLMTYTTAMAFAVGTNLHIGSGVLPGSLALVRGGQLMTDEGGRLMLGGNQLGTFDYANGIATLMQAGFPTTGTLQITYAPGVAIPADISSIGQPVTAEGRRMNYVFTLPVQAAAGSLQVHYRVGGRWYVLIDDGSGALGDGDASHGVGQYNRSTRTLIVTVGALPDVGSCVIFTYAVDNAAGSWSNHVDLKYAKRFVIPINSDGQISNTRGSSAFVPGQVAISWTVAETTYNAHDSGTGALTGDATGVVDYQGGLIIMIPNILPPPGTAIVVLRKAVKPDPQGGSWSGTGHTRTINLGGAVKQGSVSFPLTLELPYVAGGSNVVQTTSSRPVSGVVNDQGGTLRFFNVNVGTISYTTGVLTLSIPTTAIAEAIANAAGVNADGLRLGTVSVS